MQGGASSHGRSVDDDEDDDSNDVNRVERNTRVYLCLLNKRVNCDYRDDVDTIRKMHKIKEGTLFIVNRKQSSRFSLRKKLIVYAHCFHFMLLEISYFEAH